MTVFERRERRARFLAGSYPVSAEILTFYAGIASWQHGASAELKGFGGIPGVIPSLCALVERTGPAPLAEAARKRDPSRLAAFVQEYWKGEQEAIVVSPDTFFARVILQSYAAGLPEGLDCPWCMKPPLAGCLSPQGDGQALHLVCALCLRRRPSRRAQCAACGESSDSEIASFAAAEYPHLRVQTCETCGAYLVVTDLTRDPAAIPEVDELAALPLHLWALAQGYVKLQPNLAGV